MGYPVLDILLQLKSALAANPVVILQAPPGAGKSTVLPIHLMEEEWLRDKKIILLEPRRLAVKTVANRLASQLDEMPGDRVGFRIRFEGKHSDRTRIEVVTEGILTRMIQTDSALPEVGLVIFDEFHERSLQADLALALTLQIQQFLRADLKILIMSATLDGETLSTILGHAPVITSEGRQYPVERRYLNIDPDQPLPNRVSRAIRKALTEEKGDILAFLPGAGEIMKTRGRLEEAAVGAVVHTLFGDLPMKLQQEAILPDRDGRRKIILATSIAETSLTIEGVTVVIDSGYSRVPRFDVRSGLTRLETIRVTRDAADQRAGRAGRLGPGICYRLWAEATHGHLAPTRVPEIMEADLAPLLLELGQWGVRDLKELNWVTMPPTGAVQQAGALLEQLGATKEGVITDRGKEMVKLPTHPRIAHMLLEAKESRTTLSLACDLAALLEERDPLPKEAGADLSLRVELLRRWRSGERVNAERSAMERLEKLASSWRNLFRIEIMNSFVADQEVGGLLAAAYPERIARQEKKNSERYKLSNGRAVRLPANDPLMREEWLSVAHLDGGSAEGKIFLAAPLDPADLLPIAVESEVVTWDEERGMIVALKQKQVGGLVLSSRPLHNVDENRQVEVLCKVIRENGLRMIGWNEGCEEWCARVSCLRLWREKEVWPDVSEASLLGDIENWLAPYLAGMTRKSDFNKLALSEILNGILPWELQKRLRDLAPEKLEVPSGSWIRIHYFNDGQAPVMEVRLQEVFGLLETPTVNEGRTKVLLHLLSPGYKPVQVTQDLHSFWETTYHQVRKELRMRYPRHSWPEDPWTATAIRGAKKRT